MHLKAMRLWMGAYVIFAFFDVIVTYIFVSGPDFEIADEGNAVIRSFMEQYGIWQGLTLYLIQEFAMFFLLWGIFYYILKRLIKEKSEQTRYKVDIIVFNLGVPFIIMASALLHLFGGIFWLSVGLSGKLYIIFPLKLIVYVTVICGIFQAYHVLKLSNEYRSTLNQSAVSGECVIES